MDRNRRYRQFLYGAIILIGLGIWWPLMAHTVGQWLQGGAGQNNIALVYTTDLRGFLETCG